VDPNDGLPRSVNGAFLPGLDILEVSVTNDAVNVYFLIKVVPDSMRTRPEYPFDPLLVIFVDTDLNPLSGCRWNQANGEFGPLVNVGYERVMRVSFRSPPTSFVGTTSPSTVPSCFASPTTFPGALKVASSPGFIEISVPRTAMTTTANSGSFDFFVLGETDSTRQIRYAFK
jgi:hypothetical protein